MPLCLLGFCKCRFHCAMKFQPINIRAGKNFQVNSKDFKHLLKWSLCLHGEVCICYIVCVCICLLSHILFLWRTSLVSLCIHTYIPVYIHTYVSVYIHTWGKAVISECSSTCIEQSFSYYTICLNFIIYK